MLRRGDVVTMTPAPSPVPGIAAPVRRPRVVRIGEPGFGEFISSIPTTLVT